MGEKSIYTPWWTSVYRKWRGGALNGFRKHGQEDKQYAVREALRDGGGYNEKSEILHRLFKVQTIGTIGPA